jgi:hypothetical protein
LEPNLTGIEVLYKAYFFGDDEKLNMTARAIPLMCSDCLADILKYISDTAAQIGL